MASLFLNFCQHGLSGFVWFCFCFFCDCRNLSFVAFSIWDVLPYSPHCQVICCLLSVPQCFHSLILKCRLCPLTVTPLVFSFYALKSYHHLLWSIFPCIARWGVVLQIIESINHKTSQAGWDLEKSSGPNILRKREIKWDYLTLRPVSSWKPSGVDTLSCPWGDCFSNRFSHSVGFFTSMWNLCWHILHPFCASLKERNCSL